MSATAKLLTAAELVAALAGLPGWRHSGGCLLRRLRLRDFRAAMAFCNAVAERAEAMQHHPDWSNSYARVEIRLRTHDAGGITARDIALAQQISALAAPFGAVDDVLDGAAVARPRELPPLWFVLALALQVLFDWQLPLADWPGLPWWAGLPVVVGGAALTLWAAGLFRRRGTGVRPFTEATALVVSGPYRWTRNPMYLGMVVVVGGVAMLLGSLSPWVVVPLLGVLLGRRFARREEQFLVERFGDDYLRYCLRVGRWW